MALPPKKNGLPGLPKIPQGGNKGLPSIPPVHNDESEFEPIPPIQQSQPQQTSNQAPTQGQPQQPFVPPLEPEPQYIPPANPVPQPQAPVTPTPQYQQPQQPVYGQQPQPQQPVQGVDAYGQPVDQYPQPQSQAPAPPQPYPAPQQPVTPAPQTTDSYYQQTPQQPISGGQGTEYPQEPSAPVDDLSIDDYDDSEPEYIAPPEPLDDSVDGFEQLSETEVANADAADSLEESTGQPGLEIDEEEEYVEKPKKRGKLPKKKRKKLKDARKDDYSDVIDDRFEEGSDTQFEPADEYVDKKKKKIIPFGGRASKPKKIKGVKKYDNRKDALFGFKVLRIIIMVGFVGIIALGIKNTFFLSVPNEDKIAEIARLEMGETGFPTSEGAALAEQYAEAYLRFDSSKVADRSLAYFYNGNEKDMEQPSIDSRMIGGKAKQNILVAPRVFKTVPATEYSQTYYVSALVSDLQGKSSEDDGTQTSRWVALAINILYDKKNNQLEIAPNAPVLVPTFKIAGNKPVSKKTTQPLGTGNEDTDAANAMKPTITGYLEAYGKSTTTNHSRLNQYIENKPDSSVINGFGSRFRFDNNEGTFSMKAYPVEDGDSNNQWKVDLTVSWIDNTSKGDDKVSYSGRYVMTVKKSDGKYFITKFVPYTYVQSTEND